MKSQADRVPDSRIGPGKQIIDPVHEKSKRAIEQSRRIFDGSEGGQNQAPIRVAGVGDMRVVVVKERGEQCTPVDQYHRETQAHVHWPVSPLPVVHRAAWPHAKREDDKKTERNKAFEIEQRMRAQQAKWIHGKNDVSKLRLKLKQRIENLVRQN